MTKKWRFAFIHFYLVMNLLFLQENLQCLWIHDLKLLSPLVMHCGTARSIMKLGELLYSLDPPSVYLGHFILSPVLYKSDLYRWITKSVSPDSGHWNSNLVCKRQEIENTCMTEVLDKQDLEILISLIKCISM